MMDRNFRKDGIQSMTPDRVEKMLKTSNRQVETLTNLIEDLMDVSRISNGKLILEPVNMDLVEMVKDVVEYFSEHLLAANCKVTIQAPLPVVGLWDRERVQQVIVNLVSNAIKYAPGTPLEIEVQADDRTARLKVTDHGPGIAEKDQLRIFERFERAVQGRESASGLGLGLFIVKEIVTAQGGRIWVESTLEKGSTFTVELPLKRSANR
jgi:signal transduction histidine kinase